MSLRRIVVSPKAREQIENAERYIREEQCLPKSAENLMQAIEDAFGVLQMFPKAYPIDEQRSLLSGKEIRRVNVRSFRMLYRIDDTDTVRILSFRFGNEKPSSLRAQDLI